MKKVLHSVAVVTYGLIVALPYLAGRILMFFPKMAFEWDEQVKDVADKIVGIIVFIIVIAAMGGY